MGYYKESPKYKDTLSVLISNFGEIRFYKNVLDSSLVIYGCDNHKLDVLLNIDDDDPMYYYIIDFVEARWYKKQESSYISYKR